MEVDPEFRDAVKAYLAVHDKLKETSTQARELRGQLKELSEEILKYMRKNEIDVCTLNDGGKLVRSQSRRVKGLKKEHIFEELKKIVQNEDEAEKALVNIFNKRTVDTVDALRRTRTKGT
jgi:hypothetical protein